MEEPKHIIVIGASAGGFSVITKLLSHLRPDIDAAIFIALHVPKMASEEVLLKTLQKNTALKCVIPVDNEEIKRRKVYLAPPDHHLILKRNKMLITFGPTENRFRPSIDVLFRSAAAAYASQVIGIILTGLLDDGTSGMDAIKRSGGICIVQEPSEAEFDSMPANVLKTVDVDYRLSVNDIPFVLEDIFARQTLTLKKPREDIVIESGLTEKMISDINPLAHIGTHSNYTCPDCGGNLWKIKNDVVPRYRCHTGHVYTEKNLVQKQSETLLESLWITIRMMEEQKNLLMAIAAKKSNSEEVATLDGNKEKAEILKIHIERLKIIVLTLGI